MPSPQAIAFHSPIREYLLLPFLILLSWPFSSSFSILLFCLYPGNPTNYRGVGEEGLHIIFTEDHLQYNKNVISFSC